MCLPLLGLPCIPVIMSSCPAHEPVNGSYILLCQTQIPLTSCQSPSCWLLSPHGPASLWAQIRDRGEERNERGKVVSWKPWEDFK